MGFLLLDEHVEAPLADKDATEEDRDVITQRADRARAWWTACLDARKGLIVWEDRPPWRKIDA